MSEDEAAREGETIDADQTAPSLDEELGNIFDEANAREDGQPRDEHGRFAPKEAAAEPEKNEAESAAEEITDADQGAGTETDEPARPGLEPPASWSATAKANWPNLSPELQEEILKRETDWQKADGERATRMKVYEPIDAALEPVRQQLSLSGIEPATYVRQLVAADRMLREQPQQAIREIARMYGIDLSQQEPDPLEEMDPAIAPLVTEINQLKSQLTGFVSSQQQAEADRAQAELSAFATDHPHFEEVRADMGALMQAGRAQTLQDAYDMAVWANPQTRAKLQAEQTAATEARRKEEANRKASTAKRVAATNLSSQGTSGGAAPVSQSREEELGEIYDRAQGAA